MRKQSNLNFFHPFQLPSPKLPHDAVQLGVLYQLGHP